MNDYHRSLIPVIGERRDKTNPVNLGQGRERLIPQERVLFVCVQSEKVKAESLTAVILFNLFLYFMNNKSIACHP